MEMYLIIRVKERITIEKVNYAWGENNPERKGEFIAQNISYIEKRSW